MNDQKTNKPKLSHPVLTHVVAGIIGFFAISVFIAGLAFIPIFYECRIAESAACMYEPQISPAKALAEAKTMAKIEKAAK